MRPNDQKRAREYEQKLIRADKEIFELPGIRDDVARKVYIEQLIESIRRIEFVRLIRDEPVDAKRADPHSPIFDPLRAAVLHLRNHNFDESFWLIFLFVHFGKHVTDGYRLVRDVYGALGGEPWTWQRIISDVDAFRKWVRENQSRLSEDGVQRRFGNHRKYESLDANANNGIAAVIESYVAWVRPPRTHQELVREITTEVGQNPQTVFDALYRSMNAVHRFGRLAKFDYLTMLGKIGLAPIVAGSAYLGEATGPKSGAKLLFYNDPKIDVSVKLLDEKLVRLDECLDVGMQVLEDSLCNWQKSPTQFISFRG